MPRKRRNHGRNKKNRGHTRPVVCTNCGRLVGISIPSGKDKAIKKFVVRDIVDSSTKRDIRQNKASQHFIVPKFFLKYQYCVSCAIHSRVVRVRSRDQRRSRKPPERVKYDQNGKPIRKQAIDIDQS